MSETPAGEHGGDKDAPVRRDCPDCGGYQFKSVAGIWRHWPIGPDFESPVGCPIASAETAEGSSDE